MSDIIEEELKLMFEDDQEECTLNKDTFKAHIDALNLKQIKTLDMSATMKEALEIIQTNSQSAVPITKDNKLCGLLKEQDIIHKAIKNIDCASWINKKVSEYMTKDPLRLHLNNTIATVMYNMHIYKRRHMVIVDDNHFPIHVVSLRHINSFIVEHFPKTMTNVPATPFKGVSKREDA